MNRRRNFILSESERRVNVEMERLNQFYSVEVAEPDREILNNTPVLKKNRVVY